MASALVEQCLERWGIAGQVVATAKGEKLDHMPFKHPLADMDEVKANILAALERVCKERNLTWALLLVTDVTREHSVLLCSSWPAAAKEFAYKRLEENIFDLPGILSRKKQLLPEILRILDVVAKG